MFGWRTDFRTDKQESKTRYTHGIIPYISQLWYKRERTLFNYSHWEEMRTQHQLWYLLPWILCIKVTKTKLIAWRCYWGENQGYFHSFWMNVLCSQTEKGKYRFMWVYGKARWMMLHFRGSHLTQLSVLCTTQCFCILLINTNVQNKIKSNFIVTQWWQNNSMFLTELLS